MIYDIFEGYSILYSILSQNEYKLIISNFLLYMFSLLFFIIFLRITFVKNNLFHLGMNVLVSINNFIHNLIITYLQSTNTLFFIWLNYLFLYIAFNNLLGILPFSYTINSHLNITGMLSFLSWLAIVFIGLNNFGINFYSLFIVSSIPKLLIFFLASIELLSYIFRFLSLSLRLFANIVAGHILLETIYIFLFKLFFISNNNKIINLLILTIPISFFIILILFEMVISLLQGYIFIVLVLIYLKDSLYLH